MEILEIAANMSGFRCRFCKGSLMKVHYPKLYNMAHPLALNVLLLPKDLIIIFILLIIHRRSLNIVVIYMLPRGGGRPAPGVHVFRIIIILSICPFP